MQAQNGQTDDGKHDDYKQEEHHEDENWRVIKNVAKLTRDEFHYLKLPDLSVGIILLLIGPAVGAIMSRPKFMIYGAWLGVTLLLLIIARRVDIHYSNSQRISNTAIKTPDAPTSAPDTTPDPPDAYSRLSNNELRWRTFALASELREVLKEKETQSRIESAQNRNELMQAKTKEERQQVFLAQQQRTSLEPPLWTEINERFRTTPLLLRNELRKRLPTSYQGEAEVSYKRTVNPLVLSLIIDDLEKMANSLP